MPTGLQGHRLCKLQPSAENSNFNKQFFNWLQDADTVWHPRCDR